MIALALTPVTESTVAALIVVGSLLALAVGMFTEARRKAPR